MAMSVEDHITRELARLNIWRDIANPQECDFETELAHDRINTLLDEWEANRSHTTAGSAAKPAEFSAP